MSAAETTAGSPTAERRQNCGRRELDHSRLQRAQALADRYCDRLERAITKHRTEVEAVEARYREELARRMQAEQERDRLTRALHDALTRCKALERVLPVCGRCKKLRLDDGYRQQVARFLMSQPEHAHASLGLCPECAERSFAQRWGREDVANGKPAAVHANFVSFQPLRFVESEHNGHGKRNGNGHDRK